MKKIKVCCLHFLLFTLEHTHLLTKCYVRVLTRVHNFRKCNIPPIITSNLVTMKLVKLENFWGEYKNWFVQKMMCSNNNHLFITTATYWSVFFRLLLIQLYFHFHFATFSISGFDLSNWTDSGHEKWIPATGSAYITFCQKFFCPRFRTHTHFNWYA